MNQNNTSGKRKVVLYNPRAVFYTMPLALLAVGSALDPKKYDVRIVDGRLEKDPVGRVLSHLEGALCLAVTVITGAPIRDALNITRATKAARPDLPVVWGGWHPSLFPAETLDEPNIDVTVKGQGEIVFKTLVEKLASGASWENLAGIACRSKDGVRLNPSDGLTDINELPPHNYDLIPVEKYFVMKGRRQLDYIASLGCRYRCGFCSDSLVYSRRHVSLSPERISEDISGLWRRYRFDDLSFQDETFFTSPSRISAIVEQLIKREHRFTWSAAMRADQGVKLTDEIFRLCARSGLRQAIIGVESGSREMLDWMRKDITIEQVLECADKCRRHGIGAVFPFIVGFPDESKESVRASMNLAKRLRRMSARFETPFFFYQPFPGSLINEGLIRTEMDMPETLEAWSDFDFIGSSGPWVDPDKHRLIKNFKFFNHLSGYGDDGFFVKIPRKMARWRCRFDFYRLPLERILIEWMKPPQKLS